MSSASTGQLKSCPSDQPHRRQPPPRRPSRRQPLHRRRRRRRRPCRPQPPCRPPAPCHPQALRRQPAQRPMRRLQPSCSATTSSERATAPHPWPGTLHWAAQLWPPPPPAVPPTHIQRVRPRTWPEASRPSRQQLTRGTLRYPPTTSATLGPRQQHQMRRCLPTSCGAQRQASAVLSTAAAQGRSTSAFTCRLRVSGHALCAHNGWSLPCGNSSSICRVARISFAHSWQSLAVHCHTAGCGVDTRGVVITQLHFLMLTVCLPGP
jgi:hypothetical protein